MPTANIPGAIRPIHPTSIINSTIAVIIMMGALNKKVLIIMK
jgi:hypothetical protein